MLTVVPTLAELGLSREIVGVVAPDVDVVIVKPTPLLATPPAVTTTLPVVAPAGTVATMLVVLQEFTTAALPLKVTLPVVVLVKLIPVIVTSVPAAPEVGLRLEMVGAVSVTVKATPALETPPVVTTTLPLVAVVGTITTILVAAHLLAAAVAPLKVTVPVVPKLVPVMVTEVPTLPEVGLRLAMAGAVGAGVVTVNATPALETPPVVTTRLPVVAPEGTVATMLVALQLLTVAAVPLKVTVPVVVFPKLVPVMVTVVPTKPEVGLRLLMAGPGVVTVKATPPLETPPVATTTLPVVAPEGTVATMLVALQLLTVAAVPLKVTVPVVPKLAPEIVTVVPTRPEVGLRLLMAGPGVVTVKATPALETPPVATTTLPLVAPEGTVATMLVALQLLTVAAVPLKVTVPVVPKFAPAIVTVVPTRPEVGLRLEMAGADAVTVKATPALETPPVVTTTLPLVAPEGTVATMLVALQLLTAAAVSLKVTVPVVVFPKLVPVMVTVVPATPEVGLRLEMLGDVAAGGFTVRPKPWFTP